jgi:hypothetical protein
MTKDEVRYNNSISQGKRRAKLKQYILDLGCAVCNNHHPGVLEVHHLSSSYKRYKRSQDLMYNVEDLKEGKAIVLCANCHNIFHYHFGGKNSKFPDQSRQSTIDVINLELNKKV